VGFPRGSYHIDNPQQLTFHLGGIWEIELDRSKPLQDFFDKFDITYLTGILGSGALPGCMYLIVKKSDYNANRLKLKPEL